MDVGVRWPDLTVNPLAHAYVGSDPTPSTNLSLSCSYNVLSLSWHAALPPVYTPISTTPSWPPKARGNMGRYPHMVLHRRRWMVRLVVPADVRPVLGQTVYKISTGETDEHRAVAKAAPIIAILKDRIRVARATLKKPIETKAEELAEAYRVHQLNDPASAQAFVLSDVITFVLQQQGHSWADFGRQVREAGYDAYAGLRLLPNGEAATAAIDEITSRATPFLKYFDDWKPNAGLVPRCLDQAISTLKQFSDAVRQPIEALEARYVQAWVDGLINPHGNAGMSAKTVNRKLSELRNYWRYLQSHQVVPEDRLPFEHRRVKDPPHRRKTKEDRRQRFQAEEVVRLWHEAERRGDLVLSYAIRIAAYSGARLEGPCELKATDIRVDPDTGIEFMRMSDAKTESGDRFVPIHPKIVPLIHTLAKGARRNQGYLLRINANNKYNERGSLVGKRFGILKTKLGFDSRFVFHSMRKTVANMFENAECPEGVAADVVGHLKPTMTYGLYSGITRMDLRARWMEQAIRYPTDITDVRHPGSDGMAVPPPVPEQAGSPASVSVSDVRNNGRSHNSQGLPRAKRSAALKRRTASADAG
jgi:integrase